MESDWVYCHFRQKKDSLNNFNDKLSILITLKVDKTGIIYDVHVHSMVKEDILDEIRRITASLPSVEPATEDGRKVEGEILLLLSLNKKLKRKKCH